jgi:acetylornithine deacetylase
MSPKAKVSAILDSEIRHLIGLTQDLVRIPSVNPKFETGPGLNRESDVQARLQTELVELGFDCMIDEVFPGRPNLVARSDGSDARSLVLNGHVDVVPTGDVGGWTVDPFGGEVRDGRVHGRGAVDMKGGIAAAVAALRALKLAGITLEGWVDLHTVVDEEAGGFGSIQAVRTARHPSAAVIMEPTWGAVMPAEGGLDWVRVTIRGRSGHSAWRYNEVYPQPHLPDRLTPAVNAIELGTRFMTALTEFERGRARRLWHPLLPPGVNSINPGAVFAGAGLLPNGLPATVTNPAIIPDVFVADLDYKFLPQEKTAEVRAEFEAFVHHFAQTDAWLRDNPPLVQWNLYGLHFPPMNTDVDHPLVQGLVDNLQTVAGAAPLRGFEAVCDGAHYAGEGIPCAIFGPTGAGLHGTDEYVTVDSLLTTAKVLASTMIDYCGVRSGQ